MNTFGILGLGFISKKHIEAIQANNGKITAVYDIRHVLGFDDDVRNYSGKKMEAFLSDDSYEWLVICLPNYLHYSVIFEAIEQYGKKKIICEKPLCLTEEEYDHLLSYEEEGIEIYTTFQLRSTGRYSIVIYLPPLEFH